MDLIKKISKIEENIFKDLPTLNREFRIKGFLEPSVRRMDVYNTFDRVYLDKNRDFGGTFGQESADWKSWVLKNIFLINYFFRKQIYRLMKKFQGY